VLRDFVFVVHNRMLLCHINHDSIVFREHLTLICLCTCNKYIYGMFIGGGRGTKMYRVTQKKGTHLHLQSPVTWSKINLSERFKNQRNRADNFEVVNEFLFFYVTRYITHEKWI